MKMIEFGERIPGIEYQERVGAYALVLDDLNNIAIIKTDRGNFLPGGGLEDNETLEECLHRELLEETGYTITIDKFIGSAVLYEYSPRLNIYIKGIGYFYMTSLVEKICNPKEEYHCFTWMKAKEASKTMLLQHQSWAIEQVLLNRA